MHPASLILFGFVMVGSSWLLTFVMVVGPAVWSRDPDRRRDARSVLQMILDHLKHSAAEQTRER